MKTIPSARTATDQSIPKASMKSAPSASVVKRPGKTKVRAVPDFSRLHKKWEKQLEQGKACTKKPCTKVEQFHLSTPGSTSECVVNVLNEENEENMPPPPPDPQPHGSILPGKGFAGRTPTSQATIAGPSRRVPLREYATAKLCQQRHKAAETESAATKKSSTKDPLTPTGKGDAEFVSDQESLQSILNNKGISSPAVPTTRQTIATGPACRTPVLPKQSVNAGRATDVRHSIYYTGPKFEGRKDFYTEFTQRIVSRLGNTTDNTKSPSISSSAKRPGNVCVVPERNSIYCKVKYYERLDNKEAGLPQTPVPAHTKTPRCTEKAGRVPVSQSAPGSKARRILKSDENEGQSWANVLSAEQNAVKTKLNFQDLSTSPPPQQNDDNALESLEEAEKRLEAEIAAAEALEKQTASEIAAKQPKTESETKPTRVVFGMLSKDEIVRRSVHGYDPKNPKKTASPVTTPKKAATPRSTPPLRCRDLPLSSSPHHQSRPQRYSHRSPRVNHPQSPLVTSDRKMTPRYGERSCQKKSTVAEIMDTTLDIVTVSAMDKSKLDITALEQSWSPGKKSMSPNLTPQAQRLEQQVLQIAASLDKENSPFGKVFDKENITPKSSPGKLTSKPLWDKLENEPFIVPDSPLSLCSPKTKRELQEKFSPYASPKRRTRYTSPKSLKMGEENANEENKQRSKEMPKKVRWEKNDKVEGLKEDMDNMTIDDLGQTINNTQTKIDELSKKALEHVGVKPEARSESSILQQMDEIRQRQEQLLSLQLQLQSQLQKQSPPRASPAKIHKKESTPHVTYSPPSTPATTSQSYADFIAANVEDISPYVPENLASRMPFQLTSDKHRSKKVESEIMGNVLTDQVVPIEVAQSILEDSPVKRTPIKPSHCTPCKSTSWSPVVYSPKPVMAGLAQLMQPGAAATEHFSPIPINTPLALRSMAAKYSPPQCQDLLELSSAEISMTTDTQPNKFFPTPPEYSTSNASGTISSLRSTPGSKAKNGQAGFSSLTTTTLSFSSPQSAKHHGSSSSSSQGSLSLLANLTPRSTESPFSSSACLQSLSTSSTSSFSSFPRSRVSSNPSPCRSNLFASPNSLFSGSSTNLSKSLTLAQAAARFHDTLLDEEVALYACRVRAATSSKLTSKSTNDARLLDPVAETLTYGDGMHFIPVEEEHCVPRLAAVEGSAFSVPLC